MPRALRAARLRHEAVDDAMKHDAVVEAFARQLLDALDVLRREIGAQLDHDRALAGFDDERVLGIFVVGQFEVPFFTLPSLRLRRGSG